MNILIIGNGFDIAHKLPTKYAEFLHVCSIAKKAEVTWINHHPSVSIKNLKESEKKEVEDVSVLMGETLWDEFTKLLRNNFWISHFQMRKEVIGENWINFEDEIKSVLESLYTNIDMMSDKNEVIQLEKIANLEIIQFCKNNNLQKNNQTYRDLYEKLMYEQRKVARILEIYMDGYINRKEIKLIPYIKKKNINKVLSFNYTDIYSEKYDATIDCCYIHGRADVRKERKKCDLVLGFDDHYVKEAKVIPELIPFEKYYQRIVNETDNQYFEWLKEMNSSDNNSIVVFGHSFGQADGDILRDFFMHEKAKVTIFYYNEFDRAEKIKNLAVILGPDNLIKSTGGSEPKIVFETY